VIFTLYGPGFVTLYTRIPSFRLIAETWRIILVHAAPACTAAVCVLVNVVNHTERIAPTATVKPIKRTVATKELIAFFIIFHLNSI
jgi:hypothetical protein